MTKDKFTLSDLAALLAEKSGIGQKAAEDFMKQFFVSLENGLLANEQIKIKNFGTFKLQWNEARKSVNVNTGEEIIINGFYKVVFAPDTLLKEKVNEPFAHLEPVILDEVIATEPDKTAAVSGAADPLRTLNEQASEIKNILSELKTMGREIETPVSAEVDPEEMEDNILVEMDDEDETQDELEQPDLESNADIPDVDLKNESEDQVVIEEAKAESLIPETPAKASSDIRTEQEVIKKRRGIRMSVPSFILILVGVMLVSAGVIYGLLYKDHLREMLFGKPVQARVVVIADTVKVIIRKKTVEKIDTTQLQNVETVKAVEQTDTLAFLQLPRTYTKFKGTEELKDGTRLTRLATKYYGHRDFWVYIYEANRDLIKNPDVLPLGVSIKIPELDPKLVDKENKVCIRFARDLQTKYLNNSKK